VAEIGDVFAGRTVTKSREDLRIEGVAVVELLTPGLSEYERAVAAREYAAALSGEARAKKIGAKK
jgi:hypothetical protein